MESKPRDRRKSPKSIRIVVDGSDRIVTDNGDPSMLKRSKVWAYAGRNFALVIENRDTVRHRVRIPIKEFQPKKGWDPEMKVDYDKLPGGHATPDPLMPNQIEAVVVKPGTVAVIFFKVKSVKDLKFNDRPAMTYKFNIHSTPAGRKPILLDPDIEIDKP